MLTDRRNVVVIADEAHRSQYGFEAKVERKTGDISYGFAKYLRDGLPNASFIGFTGTPIEKEDVNTPAVFGDYIDIYDISRAVEDGATVPIYYESRLARIELDEDEKTKDRRRNRRSDRGRGPDRAGAAQAQMGERRGPGRRREAPRTGRRETSCSTSRRGSLALDGKGMIVCMSRRICVALYDAIVKLRPEWHSDDDEAGAIKVVMTGAASDPPAWQAHIGKRPKARRELLAKRAKNPNDPLKLVIVRDMWLTGFDAPCMHTMYVDKPMQGPRADAGHRPRQPRVPRQAGGSGGRLHRRRPEPQERARPVFARRPGADRHRRSRGRRGPAGEIRDRPRHVPARHQGRLRLSPGARRRRRRRSSGSAIMAGAIDWVLTMQQEDAAKETTEEGKKRAHRRYADAVLALSKAFALAAASDDAAANPR